MNIIKRKLQEKLEERAGRHKQSFLDLLNKNMTEDEQSRLIKTWNEASEEQKAKYYSNPKRLIKDVGISRSTMRKVKRDVS